MRRLLDQAVGYLGGDCGEDVGQVGGVGFVPEVVVGTGCRRGDAFDKAGVGGCLAGCVANAAGERRAANRVGLGLAGLVAGVVVDGVAVVVGAGTERDDEDLDVLSLDRVGDVQGLDVYLALPGAGRLAAGRVVLAV